MQANPILLQRKYARIVKLFAEQTGLSFEQALDFFYKSKTFELISEGVADMHCLSDEYLAEELIIFTQHPRIGSLHVLRLGVYTCRFGESAS
jgi:hypothetical protein